MTKISSSGFTESLALVAERAASAVISQGRLRSTSARKALFRRLSAGPGIGESFIADPVFEASRVWRRSESTLDDLAGSFLEEELVTALVDAPTKRWPRDADAPTRPVAPYRHQVLAWNAARDGKSFLVTSGTGSGKTECFMVPILDDLLKRSGGRKAIGTQAIVIYPLNALIESQRERLGEWMARFAGRLSYALYNRYMKQELPLHQWPDGAQVPDRKRLRDDPASVLVTNTTMLEYLLMRAEDQPILEKSQGTLKWIVLDEAHSYVGAQAAEMALLLRRVRQAFGVRSEDVRIAATSATIGEGKETRETLGKFVADLGGISCDQVVIIEGEEDQPALPPASETRGSLWDIPESTDQLWNKLARLPQVQLARQKMREGGLTLSEATKIFGLDPSSPESRKQAMGLLEAMAQAIDPESRLSLAPWRLHVFHRAQPGFWACIDGECKHQDPELSAKGSDWPFGQLWIEERKKCDCGAPVFEIAGCGECGTPWLKASRVFKGPHEYLQQSQRTNDADEYVLEVEPDDTGGQTASTASEEVLIGSSDRGLVLQLDSAEVLPSAVKGKKCVAIRLVESASDRNCCDRSRYSNIIPQRFGAPFLMGNAMPALLQFLPVHNETPDGPSRGRRLLSFTDSRQGTARFSAKLQQDAERSLTRAAIYHAVQEASAGDPDEAEKLRHQIRDLEPVVEKLPSLEPTLDDLRSRLATAEGGVGRYSWSGMKSQLAKNSELSRFAGEVWRGRPHGGDHLAEKPTILAELFLSRELFRRPRMQNNVETLGLARLVFPGLEEQARLQVPTPLKEAGHGAQVWCDLMHAGLDIVFRANLAIDLPADPVDMRHWITPRSALSAILEANAPPDQVNRKNLSRFPTEKSTSNLVRLIFRLIGGSPDSELDQVRCQTVLSEMWTNLVRSKTIRGSEPYAWRLDISKAEISGLEKVFQCPITQRILPFAPDGNSMNAIEAGQKVSVIDMPSLPKACPTGTSEADRKFIKEWLECDDTIGELRERGLWTNLQDRVAEFSPFLRSQEHSAQIDRGSLKRYEESFKAGQINILNCSTTMEMGVDIPDVGMVVNTNVPPAPTNYRQRAGRAGRRGEPWAMAFTFCKELPLDRMIFRNPPKLLNAKITAPQVQMDSGPLVQKHVNALLLGIYLREQGGLNVKTSIGSFFGATDDPKKPWLCKNSAESFFLELQSGWGEKETVAAALETLVKGTALQRISGLAARTSEAFGRMQRLWRQEYEQLLDAQAAYPDADVVHRFYRIRAKRMREDFMMTELARRGFTPAYGFPVDVVTFDHRGTYKGEESPTRPMDIAIREYSPGTEVVIDGLVHRSDGIRPSWGNRNDPSEIEDLRTLWTCRACSAFGTSRIPPEECPSCGEKVSSGELLRPVGFLGTKQPHSAYEKLDYIPPDASRVSADNGQWVSLPNPDIGRYRTSRQGRLLTTVSGRNGCGYAICISCGRAEAEVIGDGNTSIPAGLKDHFPLHPKSKQRRHDGRCSGNDEGARKIRRRVKLGTEVETDVYELQLDSLLATTSGKSQALAIAAALREAVAARLGVDAENMGFAVAPSQRSDGSRRHSVFLFDKASGGSGFSVTAAQDLSRLIKHAAQILDCPARCENGCSECILRRDTQFEQEKLDRPGAYSILNETVLPHLALPVDLKIFGDETHAITESVEDYINRLILDDELKAITLFIHDAVGEWDLSEWAGSRLLINASRSGASTRLSVPKISILEMELSQKLDLHRLLSRSNANLHYHEDTPDLGASSLLAQLQLSDHNVLVAIPNSKSARIGPDWGSVGETPALFGKHSAIRISPRLSTEKIVVHGEGNSIQANIIHQFDGPIGQFGVAFWKEIKRLRPQSIPSGSKLLRLAYEDRYLRTPLSLRLLWEVIRKAPGMESCSEVKITSTASDASSYGHMAFHNNWNNPQMCAEVMRELFAGAKVDLRKKYQCPHARTLSLEFEGGKGLKITLDQGFGAWRTTGRPIDFDGYSPAASQAEMIKKVTTKVEIQGKGKFPSPMILSW